MGAAPGPGPVDQVSFSYTSTRSSFVMKVAGNVQMNITFMSPVYPEDLGRQGLTFSYLHVDVSSVDGAQHTVQLYADVSAGESISFIYALIMSLTLWCRMGFRRPECYCGVATRAVKRRLLPQISASRPESILRVKRPGRLGRLVLGHVDRRWSESTSCSTREMRNKRSRR